MVDIHTHKIIDMIDSREPEDVVNWLKTYPNLKVISRDGSITYRNAISKAHPGAIQVSDRFHLYKNITDYAVSYLRRKLNIVLKLTTGKNQEDGLTNIHSAEYNSNLTLAEKYARLIQMQSEGKNQTQICTLLNLSSRTYKKLINATEDQLKNKFTTIHDQRYQAKIQQQSNTVAEIRSYVEQGLSKRAISRITGLSRTTITRYLDPNFKPVHA